MEDGPIHKIFYPTYIGPIHKIFFPTYIEKALGVDSIDEYINKWIYDSF